jgi:tetratricopeptide (TPR) repeat protein
MDQYNYDRLAFSLVNSNTFFPGVIYSLPGYPILLSLIYLIAGRSLDLIWFLQAGMGAVSCGLTYLIARKIVGERAGLLSAFLLVFYGPAVFYDSILIPTSAALLLSLLTLTWWIYLPGAKHLMVWLTGGVLLGLSGLFSAANLLFSLLLVCIWIPWMNHKFPLLRWKIVGLAAGILVAIVPFVLRNSCLSRSPTALTAHSGINYFIGNNPEANGGFLIPDFLTPSATGIIRDSHREAESRVGRELDPGQVSRFWWMEGNRFLLASPDKAVKLWLNKLCLIISPREYLDIGGAWGRGDSPFTLFNFPLISFGLLAPFALSGILLTARRERSRVLLYLYLGAHILAILIFYYQARARIMIVPICAIFAAGSIRSIYASLRQKRHKRLVFSALLILAAFLLTKAQPEFEMRSVPNILLFRAQQELTGGKLPEARIRINRALDLNPNLAGTYLLLGDICFREGDHKMASDYFRRECEGNPFNPEPILRSAQIANMEEDYSNAEEAARRVLSIDPLSWKAYSISADSYYYQGDSENELYHSRKAVTLNPNSVKDHSNLARHYAREGDPGMAQYHWKQVAIINTKLKKPNIQRPTNKGAEAGGAISVN